MLPDQVDLFSSLGRVVDSAVEPSLRGDYMRQTAAGNRQIWHALLATGACKTPRFLPAMKFGKPQILCSSLRS